MISSLLTLGGVSVVFGVGFVVKNGSEIMSNLSIDSDNLQVKLGGNKKKGGTNDDHINHLRKESKSRA